MCSWTPTASDGHGKRCRALRGSLLFPEDPTLRTHLALTRTTYGGELRSHRSDDERSKSSMSKRKERDSDDSIAVFSSSSVTALTQFLLSLNEREDEE